MSAEEATKLEQEIMEAVDAKLSPYIGRKVKPELLREMNTLANQTVLKVLDDNNHRPPPDGFEAATVMGSGCEYTVYYHSWVLRLARPQDFKEQK